MLCPHLLKLETTCSSEVIQWGQEGVGQLSLDHKPQVKMVKQSSVDRLYSSSNYVLMQDPFPALMELTSKQNQSR